MPFQLTVVDLGAERGVRSIFSGLSFRVGAGEALAIVGPNGAGKSTLLRMLAGLLPATAGSIALDPPDAADPEKPVAERVHYLGHADGLKSALSPAENLAFLGVLAGGAMAATTDALARFGLAGVEHLPCAYLSAGQRRRVALCRLLVSGRPLWLLDEPATALDAASARELGGVMREHLKRGGLIVAATHSPLGLDGLRELRLG